MRDAEAEIRELEESGIALTEQTKEGYREAVARANREAASSRATPREERPAKQPSPARSGRPPAPKKAAPKKGTKSR